MANPLPHEKELYDKIKQDGITIDPFIWDTMYHYLGDYISSINAIATLYIVKNELIPIGDARKILGYTRKIKGVVDKIINPETIINEGERFEKIKNGHMTLHPIIVEFFMHYIGNDTHIINFCVSYYLDPLDEQPVPLEDANRILNHTISMRQFLDKLREATNCNQGFI